MIRSTRGSGPGILKLNLIKVKENREFLFAVKKMYDLKRDSVANTKTKWVRISNYLNDSQSLQIYRSGRIAPTLRNLKNYPLLKKLKPRLNIFLNTGRFFNEADVTT